MVIGPKKLLELVEKIKLVEGLAKRELTNPEGAGFDLRLGEIYSFEGGTAFLGVTERETPQTKIIASFIKGSTFYKPSFTVQPNEYYLISTIEKLNIPENITVNFKPRTTTFRSGLFLRTGNVAPGYQGKLTFGLKNEGSLPVTLELGCRIVHAQFYWVDGGGSAYRGQWQGGRINAGKREEQV